MKTVQISLTALLLLASPALAQDAPAEPLAAEVLAKLLKAADAKQVLQHRLLTKRYYQGNERGRRTWLVTSEGSQTKAGIEITLKAQIFERGTEGTLVYRYDPQFRLAGLRMAQKRRGREGGFTVTINNGLASGQRTRDGNPRGNPREGPWTGDRLSLFSTLVLLPSLGDLGLTDMTTILSEDEDDDIGKGRKPRVMTVRREKATATRQVVWVDSARRKRSIAKVVLGVGKDQGVIQEFLIDPKPDGRSDLHLKLIDAKKAQELIKLAPLLTNEGRARSALGQVHFAQQMFKTNKPGANTGFAESIEELANAPRPLIHDKDLKEGKSPGYMILIRRSPNKQSWMAVAVPEALGKTGRFFYVVNQAGKVYQSTKEIPLDDACKIPADAKPVRR